MLGMNCSHVGVRQFPGIHIFFLSEWRAFQAVIQRCNWLPAVEGSLVWALALGSQNVLWSWKAEELFHNSVFSRLKFVWLWPRGELRRTSAVDTLEYWVDCQYDFENDHDLRSAWPILLLTTMWIIISLFDVIEETSGRQLFVDQNEVKLLKNAAEQRLGAALGLG
jgi:hypothetical protein